MVIGSGTKLTDTAVLSGGYQPDRHHHLHPEQPEQHGRLHRHGHGQRGRHLHHRHRHQPRRLPAHRHRQLPLVRRLQRRHQQQRRHDNGQNESETVSPASPAINTVAGGTVIIGSGTKLTDTAVSPAAINPTGTITFTLNNPSNTVVYTDMVTVSGNGSYNTSTGTNPGGYLPTATGTYLWSAIYSGDTNNNGATTTARTRTRRSARPARRSTPSPAARWSSAAAPS